MSYTDLTSLITSVNSATASATPSTLMKRDSNGRAQVVDPSASADIATKNYADALGTAVATVSTIVRRDSSGRASVVDPSASTDIATKNYVDTQISGISAGLPTSITAETTNFTAAISTWYSNSVGAATITLPTAVGNRGKQIYYLASFAGYTTVATTSGQVVAGQASGALKIPSSLNQQLLVTFTSDGANWQFMTSPLGSIPSFQTGGASEFATTHTVNNVGKTVALGSDGNMWYTTAAAFIGKATPAGVVTEYATTTNTIRACLGNDGNIWYSTTTNKIGKVTPSGTVTEYTLTTNMGVGLCLGGDGNIWYSATSARISKITPSGTPTDYTTTTTPTRICLGSDGNIWYVTSTTKIGRVTPSGTVTEFTTTSNTDCICLGGDGNIWYGTGASTVGKVTPSGTVTEYSTTRGTTTADNVMCAGSDGNIWFVNNGNGITRVTPTGTATDFATGFTPANQICLGPDGNVWITSNVGFIASCTPAGVVTAYTTISDTFGIAAGSDCSVWYGGNTIAIMGHVPITIALPNTATNLKANTIFNVGNQLPFSGSIGPGTYYHFGNWIQAGSLTISSGTRIYVNGSMTFTTGGFAVSTNYSGGQGSGTGGQTIAILSSPGNGQGPGAPEINAAFADTWGAAGAACGGAGGRGGSVTVNATHLGGVPYNWFECFSGSSAMGGHTNVLANNGGTGGAGGGAVYIECSGNIVFPAGSHSGVITANGGNGGAPTTTGSGGGGGSGGIVVIRCGGTANFGTATDAIQCKGGTAGSPSSTSFGNSGGGGGGIIDAQSALTMTSSLSAASACAGGSSGTGGNATQGANSGSNGTVRAVGNILPVSAF